MNEKPKPLKWDEKQYQIYALIDPRDNTIRYIGMSGDAQYRQHQHLYLNNGGGWKEREWINALKELGLSPIFQILETIDASDNARAIAFRCRIPQVMSLWLLVDNRNDRRWRIIFAAHVMNWSDDCFACGKRRT